VAVGDNVAEGGMDVQVLVGGPEVAVLVAVGGTGVFVGVKVLVGVWVTVADTPTNHVPLGVTLIGTVNRSVREDWDVMVRGLKDGIKFEMAMMGE